MSVKQFGYADAIPERSTWRYRTDIDTEDGEDVNSGDVLSVLLTLRDVGSDEIVNARDGVEVNNQNGGIVTTGRFTFQFEEDDTAILGSGTAERRLLTLDFHLSGGGRTTHEVYFHVRNFRDIS